MPYVWEVDMSFTTLKEYGVSGTLLVRMPTSCHVLKQVFCSLGNSVQ